MQNAYECKEEYSADGNRLVRRERSIGPGVPWAIVFIVALVLGRAFITVPPWPLNLLIR
jgi:hypothetical protein